MHLPKYFDNEISRGYLMLFSSRFIVNISNGLFGLFIPIFIYTTFNDSFTMVAIYYGAAAFFYTFLLPLGAQMLGHYGMRQSMWLAIAACTLNLSLLGLASYSSDPLYLLAAAGASAVVFRLLYWVPYHTSFAKFSSSDDRGRQVSLVYAAMGITSIITPIIAGIIITQVSYGALFWIGIVIYMFSIVPLLYMPQVHETFSWRYKTTWQTLFAQKNRSTFIAFFADGVEVGIGILVWPIFIFLLLDGDFFSIGALATLITAVTVALQLIVGKYSDKFSKSSFIKYGSIFYALGWIIKIFAATAVHIFFFDAYQKLVKIFSRAPFEALTYDIAADQGHYIDEFTVLKEIALNLGRFTAYTASLLLALVMPIQWLFVIAAAASLFINALRVQK